MSPDQQVYEFDGFRVDALRRILQRDGATIALTPKVFDTLLYLVRNAGDVIDKDELMRAVWPDTAVEENNLSQNISVLRRVLGQTQSEKRYILTVPGKGFRFVAEVRGPAAARAAKTPSPALRVEEAAAPVKLAVLPFENLSADPEREYLADGLTEETIAALGQIGSNRLSVIGRTTMKAYKGTSKSLAEIGRETGATYLIESSLRAEGGRLRITSKLIRANDQIQIWSASYDSEPASMLVFQRELSGVIAAQIHLRLSPERITALEKRQTRSPEAYDLYLRGRHYWNQLTPATTRRAVEYFTQATETDAKYALAWSGLSDCYTASPVNGDAPPQMVWPKAREATANAVSAEADLAEVQTSLGSLKFWLDWDWPEAIAAYRRAVALDPGYPLGHRMLGIVLSHSGQHAEAREEIRRAREIDPLLAVHQALSAQVAFAAREYDEAIQFARQSIAVDPEFWIGHLQLAQVTAQIGESETALQALQEAGRASGGNSKVLSLRAYVFARLGREHEAREILKTLEAISRERYVPPYAMALAHAGLEEREEALTWLERCYEARDVHLIFPAVDPKWDSFRAEPRFLAILKRCGFPSLGLRIS